MTVSCSAPSENTVENVIARSDSDVEISFKFPAGIVS